MTHCREWASHKGHCGPKHCYCHCDGCYHAKRNLKYETLTEEDEMRQEKLRLLGSGSMDREKKGAGACAAAPCASDPAPVIPTRHCKKTVYCDSRFCMCSCVACYQAKNAGIGPNEMEEEEEDVMSETDVFQEDAKGPADVSDPAVRPPKMVLFDQSLDGTWIICAVHGKLNEGMTGLVLGDMNGENWLGFCPACEDDLLEALLHRRVLVLRGREAGQGISTRQVLPSRLESTNDAA